MLHGHRLACLSVVGAQGQGLSVVEPSPNTVTQFHDIHSIPRYVTATHDVTVDLQISVVSKQVGVSGRHARWQAAE